MFFLNNLPYFLFSFIMANCFYISLISTFSLFNIFPNFDFYQYFYLIQTGLFIFTLIIFKRYRKNFLVNYYQLSSVLYLFIPYLIIIILRWPIYTKVHDDLTYYLVAGEYTKNLWTNPHVFPTYAIYLYNSLPLYYHSLIEFLGLRLTLLISMLSLSIWMVSLNLRFKKLVKNRFQKYLLDFFFISFPFWPHLMAIHGMFMADFFSLVFILEAFYQFISKNNDKTFAFISLVIAGLVKQSSIFFVIPVFLYLIIKNFKKINWVKALLFIFIILTYFIRLYFEVGNPLLGGLFNSIFKSPITSSEGSFGLGIPFGGKNFWQKLSWPIIAQVMPGFAEGFVSKPAKYYFTIFLAIPYLFLWLNIFWEKSFLAIVVLFSLLFWSFYIGYARWVIPLIAISWIYMITQLDAIKKIKLNKVSLRILYFIVIIISLTSIKTDFGWRPYHNLPFFKQLYIEGWQLVGHDRWVDIKKDFQGEFDGYEVVSPVRSEKAFFYSYIGYLYGLKIIHSMPKGYYERLLSSPKISKSFKEKIKNLLAAKKILLVVDTMSVQEDYVKESFIYQKYHCHRIGNFHDIKTIQFSSFSTIVKYKCLM